MVSGVRVRARVRISLAVASRLSTAAECISLLIEAANARHL